MLFGVTVGFALVLAYPIVYAQLYKYKLRNQDTSRFPSYFSLFVSDFSMHKKMPPTPANVIQYIS